MDHVTVQVQVEVSLDPSASATPTGAPSDEEIASIIEQCCADAVNGTFGVLPGASKPGDLKEGAILDSVVTDDHLNPASTSRSAEFIMKIPDWMFHIRSGGIQHLVGILASDTFPAQLGKYRLTAKVKSIELSENMANIAKSLFRPWGPSSVRVKSTFSLTADEPLVAFSFKPRVGFSHGWAQEVTRDVVDAGIHLVEFDTRNLQDPSSSINEWAELHQTAMEVANSHGRKAAFSPNISGPSFLAVDAAKQWCDLQGLQGPKVVKVDGGLDGLSTMQGIRLKCTNQPLITSYPLLRPSMGVHLGSRDLWVELLALSGADFIYPGNRPTFQEFRNVGGDFARGRRLQVMRYRNWLTTIVPTFAAGAHPGHLQAAYEILGPNVAYFLGGAIALHAKGPKAGAKLCMEILQEARELAKEADRSDRLHSKEIDSKLQREIEKHYVIRGMKAWYQPLAPVFESGELKPFYRVGR